MILALLSIMSILATFSAAADEGPGQKPSNWYDDLIFSDKSYTFEFIRALGNAPGGGSDIGECIATARGIRDGDDESWYREWMRTADRVCGLADKWEQEGHHISAREAWLRACNYYRQASFYMDEPENRPRAVDAWKKSRDCFHKAIASMSYVRMIKIPYEGTTLPGYYIVCDTSGKKRPLVIIQTGFDGTKEELFFACAQAARERGYNCLLFEGPGQGEALRVQGLHFRPDWERVITPVVNYALTLAGVDGKRIALMGISFGGYFAPRAAAFEHRLKACIANGGIYSFAEDNFKHMPRSFVELMETDPGAFNSQVLTFIAKVPLFRWGLNNGMWTFGVDTPAEYYEKVKAYTLENVVDKIQCHMLVIDSEEDQNFVGQPRRLYEALKCPKDFYVFTREETAQAHCQMGAQGISNEVIFNWLDGVLKQ